jgi:hypothetical protein
MGCGPKARMAGAQGYERDVELLGDRDSIASDDIVKIRG